MTAEALRTSPPQHLIDLAVEVSQWSPCRSKRGVVIFRRDDVISHGHNYKPRGFECDQSDECKALCRRAAVHAEQSAIIAAGGRPQTDGADMLHVKTVDGALVNSGPPSCVECSKLALACGISGFWLHHANGWHRYPIEQFHRLSLAALAAVREAPQEQELSEAIDLLEDATITVEDRAQRLEQVSRVDVHEKNHAVGRLRGARQKMTQALKLLRALAARSLRGAAQEPMPAALCDLESRMRAQAMRTSPIHADLLAFAEELHALLR